MGRKLHGIYKNQPLVHGHPVSQSSYTVYCTIKTDGNYETSCILMSETRWWLGTKGSRKKNLNAGPLRGGGE